MSAGILIAIGWRNLLKNGRRTVMLVIAVAMGVALLLFASAMMNGWRDNSIERALDNLTGHLQAHVPGYFDDPGAGRSFVPAEKLRAFLDGEPRVARWNMRLRLPVVVMSERQTRGLTLVGTRFAAERDLSFLGKVSMTGTRGADDDPYGIWLGRELVRQLETDLGKRVVVLMTDAWGRSEERAYTIRGIFDGRGTGVEKQFGFVALAPLAEVLGMAEGVNEVVVRLRDEAELDDFVTRSAPVFGPLEVKTWRQLEPGIVAMADLSQSSIWIWNFIVMTALGFGLVNTLLASVFERTRELGLLQALGMNPMQAFWQVVIESWIIVLVGLVLGFAAGYLWVAWLAEGLDLSRWAQGMESMGLDAVLVPVSEPADWLAIVGIVTATGLLGSLYPGVKAVAIDPLEALKKTQT